MAVRLHLICSLSQPLCFALRGFERPLGKSTERSAAMTDQPNPTLDKIQEMIAVAVAAALTANGSHPKATKAGNTAPKPTPDQMDTSVVRAFAKAGYGTVTPRVDVQTYGRWLAQGYKVKAGEHSVKVRQFRLFHRKQVEPFNPSTETVVPLKPKKAKKA